jgi:hypothetical protein
MINIRDWGWYGMMSPGFGIMTTIIQLVVLVDLILLGVWLWKQAIKK